MGIQAAKTKATKRVSWSSFDLAGVQALPAPSTLSFAFHPQYLRIRDTLSSSKVGMFDMMDWRRYNEEADTRARIGARVYYLTGLSLDEARQFTGDINFRPSPVDEETRRNYWNSQRSGASNEESYQIEADRAMANALLAEQQHVQVMKKKKSRKAKAKKAARSKAKSNEIFVDDVPDEDSMSSDERHARDQEENKLLRRKVQQLMASHRRQMEDEAASNSLPTDDGSGGCFLGFFLLGTVFVLHFGVFTPRL